MLGIPNMRKLPLLTFLFAFMTVTCFANPILSVPGQTQAPLITPGAPNINAKAYILMDANTGKILAEKNADARMAPASLTKLMTMYVISKAIKDGAIHMDDKVHVSTKAWRTGGSRMFLKVDDDVPVRDLLQGIVVASGNDASVAMSEHLAGTEDSFAAVMNQEAKALGMDNTHFVDSNGLPNPQHYSSAHDLAILTQAIIKTFPEDYRLYSEKWFTFNNIRQPNRNRLLWRYSYADGLKTGHTDDAGYCLVASAVKDGTRLISVVMGAPSDNIRTEESIRLLTYGFRFFQTRKLYDAGAELAKARVLGGTAKIVPLGVSSDFYVTSPMNQAKNIRTEIKLTVEPLKAPIVKNQIYGTLNVFANDKLLASQSLIALADDPKAGVLGRIIDSINFTVHKVFTRTAEKANNG